MRPLARRASGLAAVVAAALVVALATVTQPAGAANTVTVKLPHAVCPSPKPHRRACEAVRLVTRRVSATTAAGLKANGLARPAALGFGPAGGYTPTQLATAYGVNPNAATTQTVAIVDAYDDPSVLSDLDAFDANYGFPAETGASFQVVNQNGDASPLPSADTGWASEITLDVQAVRAVCRSCKILLVEADSEQNADLAAGVDRAVAMGATVVSNSYASPENDPGNTPAVVAAYNHPGVAILAGSGDEGWYGWDVFNVFAAGDGLPSSPASFPTVIGVGGTSLYLNADGTRAGEQVWNDNGADDVAGSAIGDSYLVTAGAAGSGCSGTYTAPLWQQKVAGYATLGCGSTLRSSVDIAADADWLTGFDTYETFGWCTAAQCPTSGWATYGGTSLATPLVAGLWGLAGGPKGVSSPALTLYGHYQSTPGRTYDVTIGGTGACDTGSPAACAAFFGVDNPNTFGFGPLDCAWGDSGTAVRADRAQCYAQPGYDGVSGVGTPVGLGVFAPMWPTARITQSTGVTHGTAHTFSGATSTDPFPGGSVTKYRWLWGDGTSTTTTSPTASHTYATAGTETVTLRATDNYGRAGTVTKQVTVQ